MAGRYGMSFAKSLIERGDYEEAVDAASKEITDGNRGPEPLFDRATAHDFLEAFDAAVTDFEAAIALNQAEKEIDPFVLDDAYFSALLAAARSVATRDVPKAVTMLGRYRELLPQGGHVRESVEWQKRLRGELPSLLDKTRNIDDVTLP